MQRASNQALSAAWPGKLGAAVVTAGAAHPAYSSQLGPSGSPKTDYKKIQLEQITADHGGKAGINLPGFARPNAVNGGLHIIEGPPLWNAAQYPEYLGQHVNSISRVFHDDQLSDLILVHLMPWVVPLQQFSVALNTSIQPSTTRACCASSETPRVACPSSLRICEGC